MSKSDELRKEAENCTQQATEAIEAPEKARYKRMAASWTSLANTQDWLDGEFPAAPKDDSSQPKSDGR